ncbi:MAG: hypothetical protein IPJ32_21690 [Sphingobacteriaceae bacterium]|nr:hypothetical protein [Sphingobacteriaceae bacterium]
MAQKNVKTTIASIEAKTMNLVVEEVNEPNKPFRAMWLQPTSTKCILKL